MIFYLFLKNILIKQPDSESREWKPGQLFPPNLDSEEIVCGTRALHKVPLLRGSHFLKEPIRIFHP